MVNADLESHLVVTEGRAAAEQEPQARFPWATESWQRTLERCPPHTSPQTGGMAVRWAPLLRRLAELERNSRGGMAWCTNGLRFQIGTRVRCNVNGHDSAPDYRGGTVVWRIYDTKMTRRGAPLYNAFIASRTTNNSAPGRLRQSRIHESEGFDVAEGVAKNGHATISCYEVLLDEGFQAGCKIPCMIHAPLDNNCCIRAETAAETAEAALLPHEFMDEKALA